MSFTIRPPDGGPGIGIGQVPGGAPRPQPAEAAKTSGPAFARVYELEEARRRRDVPLPPIAGDRIPAEVWDEVDAASKLVEDLAQRGQRVSFDNDRLTGRVVASLIEDGPRPTTLGTAPAPTPIALSDAVDPRSVARAAIPYRPFSGGNPYGA